MTQIELTIQLIDNLVDAIRYLANAAKLGPPDYGAAARDVYLIVQNLLSANEGLIRWLHRFRYFDFINPDARERFMAAVQEYHAMKNGPAYAQLKVSCSDIEHIYRRHIERSLPELLSDQDTLSEVQSVFARITSLDRGMLDLVYSGIIPQIDDFLKQAEQLVDSGSFDEAEKLRIRFKADTSTFSGWF